MAIAVLETRVIIQDEYRARDTYKSTDTDRKAN